MLAQIGTTMTGFDASNAFMSVHHTTLDKLVEASFEDEMDRALMRQRYRGAQISLRANSDEPRVEIVPSCGFLQGDVTGPSLFNDVYSEQIVKWERYWEEVDEDADYLHATCFFTDDTYDASSTIFADDITKQTVTKTPQEVITKSVMNQSKEHQVGFVGPGSVTSMRMLHKEGKWPGNMEKLCPTQRVLGTLC